jgi:uncharacterized protein YhaN
LELPVPTEERVAHFEGRLREAEAEVKRLDTALDQLRADRSEVDEALEALHGLGDVPSEEDLQNLREQRDATWAEIRERWLDGAPAPEGQPAEFLAERFELGKSSADEAVDRMRSQAGRVEQQAAQLARRNAIDREAEVAQEQHRRSREEQEHQRTAWLRLWSDCGFEPLAPEDMRGWVGRHARLREKLAGLQALRDALAASEGLRRDRVAGLRSAGVEAGEQERLGPLLEQGVRRLADVEALEHRRRTEEAEVERLTEELAAAMADLEGAEVQLRAWRADWAAAVAELGLSPEALPSEATDALDGLSDLLSKLDEAEVLDKRIAGMARDADAWAQELRSLTNLVAPELADLAPAQAVNELHAALIRARADQARWEELTRQVKDMRGHEESARRTIETMEGRLRALCADADCADEESLEEVERRWAHRRELQARLRRLEEDLLQQGDGASVAELEAEGAALGADRDELPARIQRLSQEVDGLREREAGLREEKGRRQEEHDRWDGSGAAAAEAEEREQITAALVADLDRYVRSRMAALVLREQIERYRAQHQDPLVRRAGELFAKLTLGSFSGVRAELDDADRAILVGIRPDGRSVPVPRMSHGTRDQLYLALRLATVQRYLLRAEALPFVVDDILINFDDERATATLDVLADLGRETQVLLFTHHRRVVEMAASLSRPDEIFVQGLQAP